VLGRILPPEPIVRREAAAMHVTLVHVRVLPGRVDDFVAATRANHHASVREPGNVRFDVLQAPDDPARFILYEAYADAHAAAAHKETAHYLAWRETVAPMMAEPRRGEPWLGLLPEPG
jgi:autoinducer 2-degrading protein